MIHLQPDPTPAILSRAKGLYLMTGHMPVHAIQNSRFIMEILHFPYSVAVLLRRTGAQNDRFDGLAKSPKIVIPAQTEVYNCLILLGYGIKLWNDKQKNLTFCEIVKFAI